MTSCSPKGTLQGQPTELEIYSNLIKSRKICMIQYGVLKGKGWKLLNMFMIERANQDLNTNIKARKRGQIQLYHHCL